MDEMKISSKFTRMLLSKLAKGVLHKKLGYSVDIQLNELNTAMVLLLTLPLEVLMDHYWTKSYAKRIPKFTELVLEYYERWQNGELDMDKLKEDLWEYGGVKLVESEGEAT